MLRLILLFLRPAGLDFASMGAGITGGLLGMANAQSIPHANFNIPGAGIQADEKMWAAIQAIQQATDRNTGMVDPVILQSYSDMLGIDLSGIVSAGTTAGGQYGGLGEMAGLFGDVMGGQASQAFGRGADIWQTSRDPQHQLHDFMRQQTIDTSRAADSARGIAMGGVSAGSENDAVRRFEMDWQNQQLGRELAGGQGANQAEASGALGLQSAMGYYGTQPGYTTASAQAPVSAQQQAYSMPMDWASMFTQAEGQNVQGPQANFMSNVYPYLGMSNQGQQNQFWGNLSAVTGKNNMQQQAQYGLWGGGQSGTNTMQGNQSGAGQPQNWYGMGGASAGSAPG